MKRSFAVLLGAVRSLCGIQKVATQTINLRYGQIPSTINTVAALQFYVAQRKGFFAREGNNLEMLPIEGGAARRSWGEKNKYALVRYVRALASSYRLMRDPAVRDEVVRVLLDTTGSSEVIARQTLSLYFVPERGAVPKQDEIDVKGFGEVLKVMGEAGELKPPLPPVERFIDLQYLKAAGLQ